MINETQDTIEFIFPLNDLFAKVSLQSMYSAKNIHVADSSVDVVDAYGISTDERHFFDLHIDKAVSDLFTHFIMQTNAIKDSLFYKKTVGDMECCGFSLVREMQYGKPLYNVNRLILIDRNCGDYLKNYILLEWAKANKLADDITILTNSINEDVRHIRNNNFEIKKGQYEKTYNQF